MVDPFSMAKLVALLKKDGPHAAAKAYKMVAPKNWAVQLSNTALKGLPRPRPRIALVRELNGKKGEILAPLMAVVVDGNPAPTTELAEAVDRCLRRSRRWRRLPVDEQSSRTAVVSSMLMQNFIASQDPAKATAVAHDAARFRSDQIESKIDRHGVVQQQLLDEFRADRGGEARARLRQSLAKMPQELHRLIESALEEEPEGVREVLSAVSTPEASAAAIAAQWVQSPPAILGTAQTPVRPTAWRVLGYVAFAYRECASASMAFERSAAAGGAARDHLMAWAAWAAINAEDNARAESLIEASEVSPDSIPILRLVAAWLRMATTPLPNPNGSSPLESATQASPSDGTDDPFADTVRLVQVELAGWDPTDEMERDLHARIGANTDLVDLSLSQARRYDAAIHRLQAALNRGWMDQTAMALADLLCERAYAGGSLDRARDLDAACELASKVRDARRGMNANSAPAAAMAARAAGLARHHRRVIEIGSSEFGTATNNEARQPAMIRYVATAATECDAGIAEALERQLPNLPEGFVQDWCRAQLLTRSNRPEQLTNEEQAALWQTVLASAVTDEERFLAERGLAEAGILVPADRSLTTDPHSWIAAESRARAALVIGDPAAAITELRPFREEVPSAALMLGEAYAALSEIDAAVDELVQAARRFDYDDFVIQAARVAAVAGQRERAESLLQHVLGTASSAWHGRPAALGLLGHLRASRGDWPGAMSFWEAALEQDPFNTEVLWSLAQCHAHRGDVDLAWTILTADPISPGRRREPPHPPHASFAQVLLLLTARNQEPAAVVERGLALMNVFDEPDFHAAALLIMFDVTMSDPDAPAQAGALDPDLLERLQAAVTTFLTDHPGHPAFRAVPVTPEMSGEEILAAMASADSTTAERGQNRKVAEWTVARGALPLGALGSFYGRRYAQIITSLAFATITAGFEEVEDEASIAEALGALGVQPNPGAADARRGLLIARGTPTAVVVIDTTALYARTLLPELDAQLASRLRDVLVADDAFMDIVISRDAASKDQGLYFSTDPDTGQGILRVVSAETRQQQRERLDAIYRLAAAARREPAPAASTSALDQIAPDQQVPWLGSVRLAAARGAFLWADDVAVRAVARTAGVRCFSTAALLHAFRRLGAMTEEQCEQAVQNLIRGHIGDFTPKWERLRDISREGDPGRTAVAAAVSKPSFWMNFEPASKIYLRLLDEFQRTQAEWVPTLVSCATLGALGINQHPEAAADQAAAILSSTINHLGPLGHVPGAIAAARGALRQAPISFPDPLPNVARRILRAQEALSGPSTAADTLMALMAGCSEEDRQIARIAILTA
ncbi:PIN domain-containing protein [Catenulispora rubra]|uniref:PIN domain-containing protein n=1 Tax=Catenulispora rubra TaxID=280293 RepID=UPI001891F88D|nr:hypothetical protein [Catenulispora rubra]